MITRELPVKAAASRPRASSWEATGPREAAGREDVALDALGISIIFLCGLVGAIIVAAYAAWSRL